MRKTKWKRRKENIGKEEAEKIRKIRVKGKEEKVGEKGCEERQQRMK